MADREMTMAELDEYLAQPKVQRFLAWLGSQPRCEDCGVVLDGLVCPRTQTLAPCGEAPA